MMISVAFTGCKH